MVLLALLLVLDLTLPVKIPDNYSTVVLDDEGRILSAYLNNEDKWRLKTNVEEVSPFFLKAIIEKEDKYFYYHFGVNPVAIFQALASNIQKKKRVRSEVHFSYKLKKISFKRGILKLIILIYIIFII